jgi:hypothetical protein
MTVAQTRRRPLTVTEADVEQEIVRLFGTPAETGLVIRVHGEDVTRSGRIEAFRELLGSLTIYDFSSEKQVEPPDVEALTAALTVIGEPRLKRRVFERILLTFGRHLVEPLGKIVDTTPEGLLLVNMTQIRDNLMAWIARLRLTQETQDKLTTDLRAVLSDEYLAELAEHEEKVQRPRVTELAKDILRLIGGVFERAFRNWPQHARTIADSVVRRMSSSMTLRESPVVIRDRIIEALEEYLWIETSTELSGAVHQLFQQPRYHGLLAGGPPDLKRSSYRQFAEACWNLISENC